MLTGDRLQIILKQDSALFVSLLTVSLYQTRRMSDVQHHHPG